MRFMRTWETTPFLTFFTLIYIYINFGLNRNIIFFVSKSCFTVFCGLIFDP